MEYKEFFIEILLLYLNDELSCSEVAEKVSIIPIDKQFNDDEELLNCCEWALRHINHDNYYPTKRELMYYLSCLKGERTFLKEDRDNLV